jgi:hypothetical protein
MYNENNPAHRVLRAIGRADLCGVYQSTADQLKTRPKGWRKEAAQAAAQRRTEKRDTASAKVAFVLREYFTRKRKEKREQQARR